ncbi:MAG: hypothetical protein ACE5OZ_14110 [Candidatus Heimdallarchaeota archaeon]
MNSKRIAVSNSGPLIHLGKAGQLELLFSFFDQILIPEKVYGEVVVKGLEKAAPDALQVKRLIDQKRIQIQNPTSNLEFDPSAAGVHLGELDAIALALELPDQVVLLDDHAGRLLAQALGLRVRGSLGIILAAVENNVISLEKGISIVRLLSRIMYLSAEVYDYVITELNNRISPGTV